MEVSVQDLALGVYSILIESYVHGRWSFLSHDVNLVLPRVDALLTVAYIQFVELNAAHQRTCSSLPRSTGACLGTT